MIATLEPRPELKPAGGRPAEPEKPDLRFNVRADACAVVLAFNGWEHRAVLDLDGRGFARPTDVAFMLESLAREVRKMPSP